MIGVFLSGVLAGSFIVLGDIFVALGASAFLSRILIGVVATFVVLPLGYPADIGRLSIGSSFSLVAFSCLAVLLAIKGMDKLLVPAADQPTPTWLPHPGFDWLPMMGSTFPVLVYACGCQIQLMDIFQTLLDTRPATGFSGSFLGTLEDGGADSAAAELAYVFPVVVGTVVLMVSLLCLIGIFGVCAFPGESIQPDVLTMLGSRGLGTVAHVVLGVAVTCSAPLLVHPARTSILGLVKHLRLAVDPDQEGSTGWGPDAVRGEESRQEGPDEAEEVDPFDWCHCLVTIGVIGTAAAIAMSVKNIMVVFGAMGAFLCAPLFFVLPAALLLWLILGGQVHQGLAADVRMKGESLLGGFSPSASPARGPLQTKQYPVMAICMCLWLIIVGVGTGAVSIKKFLAP